MTGAKSPTGPEVLVCVRGTTFVVIHLHRRAASSGSACKRAQPVFGENLVGQR
jgi:hypothetical protein